MRGGEDGDAKSEAGKDAVKVRWPVRSVVLLLAVRIMPFLVRWMLEASSGTMPIVPTWPGSKDRTGSRRLRKETTRTLVNELGSPVFGAIWLSNCRDLANSAGSDLLADASPCLELFMRVVSR